MQVDILLSGAGGQGLMTLGKIIAYSAVYENKYSTFFPCYGAEVRGGSAYCFVKISDKTITSPLVEKPDIAVILTQQSLDKFEKILNKKTILILNTDLIQRKTKSVGKVIQLPLNTIALQIGDIRVVNSIALGVLIAVGKVVREDTVLEVFGEFFSNEILKQNLKAVSLGMKLIADI